MLHPSRRPGIFLSNRLRRTRRSTRIVAGLGILGLALVILNLALPTSAAKLFRFMSHAGRDYVRNVSPKAQIPLPTPPPITDPDAHPEPSGPMVSTDRSDYEPGAVAVITGRGFHANETVTLHVTHTDGIAEGGEGHEPWTVFTDGEGKFSATWFVNPDDSQVSSFMVTA